MTARLFFGYLAFLATLWLALTPAASAEWLITPQEAAAPGSWDAPLELLSSSAGNGPSIQLRKPLVLQKVYPPVDILIEILTGNSGAAPNMASFKVVLLKLFNIDITERVRKYIKGNVLDVRGAELPEGDHKLRVSVADGAGNLSQRDLRLVISGE